MTVLDRTKWQEFGDVASSGDLVSSGKSLGLPQWTARYLLIVAGRKAVLPLVRSEITAICIGFEKIYTPVSSVGSRETCLFQSAGILLSRVCNLSRDIFLTLSRNVTAFSRWCICHNL